MTEQLYQIICLRDGMVFDSVIQGIYTTEEANSAIKFLEYEDSVSGTKYHYMRVVFISSKIQEKERLNMDYEEASATVINRNGLTLYDCSAAQLAQIAAGDSEFAEAALIVLEHDYVSGASDRAYYSRNYGVVWK